LIGTNAWVAARAFVLFRLATAPGDTPDAIEFVLDLARALHRYGTPAHRLEEALLECCRRLGMSAEVFTTPTTIIMSFGEPEALRTRMMRVEGGELDMSKLALADAVAGRRVTPTQGVHELAAILAAPRQFGHALSTRIASSMWSATSPSIIVVAALSILLPGMSLTVAMTELATRNLMSGTARLMSAVIVLLELVVGVALGERAASALVQIHRAIPVPLPEWTRWIALAASAVGVAIIVQAQPRAFGWCSRSRSSPGC
jgi:uncharacterized membrane protein YjjP (DUF1212 family)